MSREMALAEDELRQACEKLRLHGSPWWREEWRVSQIASEALDAADKHLMDGYSNRATPLPKEPASGHDKEQT